MKRTTIMLGIIQLFIAIGAIPAGLSFMTRPDGAGIGMSTEILLETPFQDFFIPGFFLLVTIGLFNALGAFLSIKKNKYAGIFGLGLGLMLVLWIVVQVYFIGLSIFLQPLFFVVGIIEAMLGYNLMSKRRLAT